MAHKTVNGKITVLKSSLCLWAAVLVQAQIAGLATQIQG